MEWLATAPHLVYMSVPSDNLSESLFEDENHEDFEQEAGKNI